MRKRKERQSKTLIQSNGGEDELRDQRRSEDSDEDDDKSSGFFACYLLTSLCPRYKGHTYIGFTVNPRRRIRQHNGELCSGASRTKKKRPWEMVLCIYGFPTNVTALQFEWAWQHPVESLAVRKAAVGFKSLGGLANKIKLAYTMLTLPAWNNLNLNVNFFSTKYTKHYAGCPTLPSHMRVYIRSMDELPCYTEGCKQNEDDMFGFENDVSDNDEEPGKSVENLTVPVLYSTNHRNEEEATTCSENYDQSQDDDKEHETMPVSVFPDHQNNGKEAFCVSDDENYEQPSGTNKDIWDDDDDDDDKENETVPVSVFADHQNNGKEAFCVSDDDNYEQPSCTNKDLWDYDDDDDKEHETVPVSISADNPNNGKEAICVLDDEDDDDIPKRSFTESGCFNVVSPTKLNKNDGSKKKLSGSSGEIEVVDLFTPSPEYRSRKNRGASAVCPEIIDLTESPICV